MQTSIKTSRVGQAFQAKQTPRSARKAVVCRADLKAFVKNVSEKTAAATLAAALISGAAHASLSYDEIQGLSYMQVKGTGIANTCPIIKGGSTNPKDLKAGSYKLEKFCLEPTKITVKGESQFKGGNAAFVPTKLMTRLTYTLEQISGTFKVDGSGKVELKEFDGIDSAPVTVLLSSGERVPFLFSIKELDAKGTVDGFGGEFVVPSYRGATFLDPKGRGGATGYDTAVALPAAGDSEELEKENLKKTVALKGEAIFSIAKVDAATGEISGVFESVQPSDTDLGAKAPKDVKITGLWYAQLN